MENFEYKEKWQYLNQVCLNITDACNLACHYCFVQQQPHFMDYKTAIDSVEWLVNNTNIKKEKGYCDKNANPRINFFGGEPTLLWDDIIVPITKYIRNKYNNNFSLGMTTNCTLLSEERVKFLKDNNIGLLTSIDGDRSTQDLTRPCRDCSKSSFDMVMKNIPAILKYYPNTTFRATVNQENVKNLFTNFLFAEKLGFKQCFFSPNEREDWSEENLEILSNEVQKIFYYYLQYWINNKNPKIKSTLIDDGFRQALKIYNKLYNNEKIVKDEKTYFDSRCGIGTNYGSINYEGKIFGCQEQDSRNGTNSIFEIGDIYNGINIEKQSKLISYYLNTSDRECEDKAICPICKNIYNCNRDMCPSTSMDLFGTFHTKTKVQCLYKNCFTNNALTLLKILLNYEDNGIFRKYLINIGNNYVTERRSYHGYK